MKIKLYIAIILIGVLLVSFLLMMRDFEENRYEKKGDLLVKQIENYLKVEKKLPNNLNDLGIAEPMNEGPYYEKVDSINYKVYFNIGFDNSKIYYSKLKEWKDEQ